MKRLLPLVVCAFIAFASAFGEEPNPPVPAGETILLCPAAFGAEGGSCGAIDRSGSMILKPEWDDAAPMANCFIVSRAGKLGILARDGREICPCTMNFAAAPGGSASIKQDGRILFNSWGWRSEFIFASVRDDMHDSPGTRVFLPDGRPALPDGFVYTNTLAGKYLLTKRIADGKLRVIDTLGNVMGGRDFDYVQGSGLSDSPIFAKADGKFRFYDKDFKRTGEFEVDFVGSPSEWMIPVRIGKRWGFVDSNGLLAIPARFESVGAFNEGLCAASARLLPDGRVDMEDDKTIRPEPPYWDGALFGYIDVTGAFAIPPQFTEAGQFSEGAARVSTATRGSNIREYFYISKEGVKVVHKPDMPRLYTPIGKGVGLTRDRKLLWANTGAVFYKDVDEAYCDSKTGIVIFRAGEFYGLADPVNHQVRFDNFLSVRRWSDSAFALKTQWGWYVLDDLAHERKGPFVELGKVDSARARCSWDYTDRWGYIDEIGGKAFEQTFLACRDFSENHAAAFDGAWGYIGLDGNWEISPKYEDVSGFSEGLASVKLGGKWGVIDEAGHEVVSCQYLEPVIFSKFGAPVRVPTLWGCLDASGHVAIEPRFESLGNFEDSIAIAGSGGLFGAIDAAGAWAIQPLYASLERVGDGLLAFTLPTFPSRGGLMKANGQVVCEPRFDKWRTFAEGNLAVGCAAGALLKWGYVDHSGNWTIPPKFDDAREFSEGLAPAAAIGPAGVTWGFIGQNGEFAIPPRYLMVFSFCGKLARFRGDKWTGFLDRNGEVAIKPAYYGATDFLDGVALAFNSSESGILIDGQGKQVSPKDVNVSARTPAGFVAWVPGPLSRGDRLYGVLGNSGEWLIEPAYAWMVALDGPFPIGAKKGEGSCLLDGKGVGIDVPVPVDGLGAFHAGCASCRAPGKGWRVIDQTGKMLFLWPFRMGDFAEVKVSSKQPQRGAK